MEIEIVEYFKRHDAYRRTNMLMKRVRGRVASGNPRAETNSWSYRSPFNLSNWTDTEMCETFSNRHCCVAIAFRSAGVHRTKIKIKMWIPTHRTIHPNIPTGAILRKAFTLRLIHFSFSSFLLSNLRRKVIRIHHLIRWRLPSRCFAVEMH